MAMIALTQQKTPAEAVLTRLRGLCEHDAKWRQGKTWSLVYPLDDMMASLPNRGDLKELVLDFLDQLTLVQEPER